MHERVLVRDFICITCRVIVPSRVSIGTVTGSCMRLCAVFRQEPGTGIWLARNLNLVPGS
jgi:hypothetical protein